uniref:Interleukin 13 receptor subunit alpha 1 n=1 Tax=Zonotrichia albicollis TaxID=44394 RepID=A0A8D2NJM4_ZONAL
DECPSRFSCSGAKVLPSPSNLNYSLTHICTLTWTWNPPENISSSCNLEYSSDIEWSKSRFRVTDAHLSEEMRLRVRSECKNDNTSEPSPWVETSLLPKGIPGTAAVDLGCVWHNLEYMACTWHRGENASSDTNYTLFYWFVADLSSHVLQYRTEPYLQLTLSKTNDRIDVKWSESETFPKSCLQYEVKYSNGDLDTGQIIAVSFHCFFFFFSSERNSVSVPGIDAHSKYSFRVRAKPKRECYSSHLQSDWSEERSIGEKRDSTIYLVLIITIPLIVAVSTIILLIYLKRLKILILPPIPDPREILKRMFGEQNEDSQVSKKLLIIEEEIHSLILTETSESSNPEKENR